MAVTNFVPDIWSARILMNLSRTSVAAGICNMDYEGDTTVGDSVKITSITDPTIGSYTGADITTEAITDATQSLLLDQKKYWSLYLDDVERAQAVNGGAILAAAVDRASYGLANTLDAYALSVIGAGASASAPDHQVAEATISTVTDFYDRLVDWAALLDAADVPPEERWAVVTPAFYGKLLKDSRFVAAGDVQSADTRQNGLVGRAAGLDVFKSNNLPDGPGAGAGKLMLVGSRYANTMAQQIRSTEAFRLEKKFGDGVKGLHVYGVKNTRPTAVVAADVIIT
jgi:hypothetical protein